MIDSALQVFAFDSAAVRVINDENGEPWFVASDIAAILGYRDAPNMVRMLDSDEAATHIVSSRSEDGVVQDREVTIISESGLYAAILKSRRPEAKRFRKWVTAEVLPSIRKTGGYQRAGQVPPSIAAFPSHAADNLVAADRIFRAGMRSGRVAGLRLSTALARANRMAVAHTGVDILAAMEVDSAQVAADEPAEDYGIGDFLEAWRGGDLPVPYTLARSSEFYRAYLCWCADNDTAPALISRFFVICHRAAPWLDKRHVSERRNDAVVRVRAVIPQGVRAGVAEGEWLNHASRELTRFASALAEWEGA
jgi:prophage antirepressor-like protein